MYNMRDDITDLERFTPIPPLEEAKMIILEQFNINQTELLFWLDNNTKVKHVLKEEEYYYIFFKNEDEYNKLSEFLLTKVDKAA